MDDAALPDLNEIDAILAAYTLPRGSSRHKRSAIEAGFGYLALPAVSQTESNKMPVETFVLGKFQTVLTLLQGGSASVNVTEEMGSVVMQALLRRLGRYVADAAELQTVFRENWLAARDRACIHFSRKEREMREPYINDVVKGKRLHDEYRALVCAFRDPGLAAEFTRHRSTAHARKHGSPDDTLDELSRMLLPEEKTGTDAPATKKKKTGEGEDAPATKKKKTGEGEDASKKEEEGTGEDAPMTEEDILKEIQQELSVPEVTFSGSHILRIRSANADLLAPFTELVLQSAAANPPPFPSTWERALVMLDPPSFHAHIDAVMERLLSVYVPPDTPSERQVVEQRMLEISERIPWGVYAQWQSNRSAYRLHPDQPAVIRLFNLVSRPASTESRNPRRRPNATEGRARAALVSVYSPQERSALGMLGSTFMHTLGMRSLDRALRDAERYVELASIVAERPAKFNPKCRTFAERISKIVPFNPEHLRNLNSEDDRLVKDTIVTMAKRYVEQVRAGDVVISMRHLQDSVAELEEEYDRAKRVFDYGSTLFLLPVSAPDRKP